MPDAIIGIPIERLDVIDRFVFEIGTDEIEPELPFRLSRPERTESTGVLRIVMPVQIPRSLVVHKSPGGYFYSQGSSVRETPSGYLERVFE